MSTIKYSKENFFERLENLVNEKMNGNWAELSRISGISKGMLSNFKRNRTPSLETAMKLADALNVTTDWLIRGKADEPISAATRQLDNLIRALTTEQREEILRLTEEKKRLNEMTELINHIKNQNNTISL